MKVLDVISSTIPNVYTNKSPKKVVYKKKKDNYGGIATGSKEGHCATDGAHSGSGGHGGSAGGATGGSGSGAGSGGAGGSGGGAGGAGGGAGGGGGH